MSILPCVVFAFNRPEKLSRVLGSLKKQKVDRLIVFVDGPRNQGDIQSVNACRAIAGSIDWVETELHLWKENHGLGGLSDNISQVFEKYPWAVFVEDDCLPMIGFYAFMRQALERYLDKREVFSIGGYQPIRAEYFRDYPYTLVSSPRFICWGWATWADRWQEILPYVASYSELFDGLRRVPEIAGADLPGIARSMAAGETVESWDVKVALACLHLKKVHLLSTRGLVRNIAQDLSGIHSGWGSTLRGRFLLNRNLVHELPVDLVWPEEVKLNCDYSAELRDYVYKTQEYSPRRLLKRIQVFLPRRLLRRPERLFDLDLENKPSIEGRKNPKHPIYQTINLPTTHSSRRALLSYLVYPFFISRDDRRFLRHINIWHAQEMVRVLNRLGYVVDVIDYRDTRFSPNRDYDVFIGHGGVNFKRIAQALPPSAKKLYFSTGSYWRFHNQEEVARFENLYQRRGLKLPYDRYIWSGEEQALSLADGVIGLGNEFTRQTYTHPSLVFMINGTSLYDDHFDWCQKDYAEGRRHFVYFSGGGNVHKGLDLLLEAFDGLEQHLWICSKIERKFVQLYERELSCLPNVHLLGWIQPRSRQFYQVMETCNFCILPSCSEGQSQSVVECMNQGLIPLVSRACGLEIDDYGTIIEPCTIEEIRRLVPSLSDYPPQRCRELSYKACAAAQNDFSEQNFLENFLAALKALGIPGGEA